MNHCSVYFSDITLKKNVWFKISNMRIRRQIFTKRFQDELFVRIRTFLCVCKYFIREVVQQQMIPSDLNGDIMVQKGIFWNMEKLPYFGILSSYIILRIKGLEVLYNGYAYHGGRILVIVSVWLVINKYSTNGNKHFGTYCMVLDTSLDFIL